MVGPVNHTTREGPMATNSADKARRLFTSCCELFEQAMLRDVTYYAGRRPDASGKIIEQCFGSLVELEGQCWNFDVVVALYPPKILDFELVLVERDDHSARILIEDGKLTDRKRLAPMLERALPSGLVFPEMKRVFGYAPHGTVVELGWFFRDKVDVKYNKAGDTYPLKCDYPKFMSGSIGGTAHIPGYAKGKLPMADFWRLVDAGLMVDYTQLIADAPEMFSYHKMMNSENAFIRYDGDADLGPFPPGLTLWYKEPSEIDLQGSSSAEEIVDIRRTLGNILKRDRPSRPNQRIRASMRRQTKALAA